MRFFEFKAALGAHVLVFPLLRLALGGIGRGGKLRGWPDDVAGSYPGSATASANISAQPAWLRRLCGTPVLITAGGEVLGSSWAILEHCGLSIAPGFRRELDEAVGPAVRLYVYHELLRTPAGCATLRAMLASACDHVSMCAYDLFVRYLGMHATMLELMGMNEQSAAAARELLLESFESVSNTLAEMPYLGEGGGAEAFGGGDLAWAALVGWVLLPPGFPGGAVSVPPIESIPASVRALRDQLLATRAGAHAVRCYAEQRSYRETQR